MSYSVHALPRWTWLAILTMLLLCFGIPCAAQSSSLPLPGSPASDDSDNVAWRAEQQKEMAKKQNLERQQEIKKDADKLLQLATELKQSVDKTTENTLSLDVIKKADQIEKLAKSVKDKMKGP